MNETDNGRDAVFLSLGFRPFFLLATLGSLVLLALWLLLWRGLLPGPPQWAGGPIAWHAHEMLFGFATAVIAGFLLTAVRNWTGELTARGGPLAVLALLWFLPQVLVWLPGVPVPLLVVTDLAFLPWLAMGLTGPLWRGKNRANRVFLLLLWVMAAANLLFHLPALGAASWWRVAGEQLMRDALLLLLLILTGRVVPLFSANALADKTIDPGRRLGGWVLGLVTLLTVAQLCLATPAAQSREAMHAALMLLCSGLALAAAVLHGLRTVAWQRRAMWRNPLLWALHLGGYWLVAALLLRGGGYLDPLLGRAAVHAFTVGGVGGITVAMMVRVTLGHTGRPLRAPRPAVAAFVLINGAALVRVLAPLVAGNLPGQDYAVWVDMAGGLWVMAFTVLAWLLTPMLLAPRVDAAQATAGW